MIPSVEFLFSVLLGYWVITHLNITKFKALRETGYHLLFNSTIVGVVIFGLVSTILSIGETIISDEIDIFYSYFPDEFSVAMCLGVVAAFLGPPIWNIFYDVDKATRRAAELNNDVIGLLVIESLEKPSLVELTLSNNKCYVGYVVGSQASRQRESDIALVPLLSGYRDKNTRELFFTTNYTDVISEFTNRESDKRKYDDFRIVVRMSEITSARFFDLEVYKKFESDRH